jgi:transcriptional regulator of heat shock response
VIYFLSQSISSAALRIHRQHLLNPKQISELHQQQPSQQFKKHDQDFMQQKQHDAQPLQHLSFFTISSAAASWTSFG